MSVQLRVSVSIAVAVFVGIGASTFVHELMEKLMKTISFLMRVMAGAARLWRSGDGSTVREMGRRLGR